MTSRKHATRSLRGRVSAVMAVLAVVTTAGGVVLMTGATAQATQDIHKSYVCKYVNKPGGGTELLQTGQNPIWVDNHSIAGKDIVSVGDKFADAQGYSQVIVANTVKLDPEPGISECPQTSTPPGDNLCPEGTDHAGQVIPDGETASTFCDDEETPPVCAEGTDHAGQVIPDGETASSF